MDPSISRKRSASPTRISRGIFPWKSTDSPRLLNAFSIGLFAVSKLGLYKFAKGENKIRSCGSRWCWNCARKNKEENTMVGRCYKFLPVSDRRIDRFQISEDFADTWFITWYLNFDHRYRSMRQKNEDSIVPRIRRRKNYTNLWLRVSTMSNFIER